MDILTEILPGLVVVLVLLLEAWRWLGGYEAGMKTAQWRSEMRQELDHLSERVRALEAAD